MTVGLLKKLGYQVQKKLLNKISLVVLHRSTERCTEVFEPKKLL